jgi:hypothetical protein
MSAKKPSRKAEELPTTNSVELLDGTREVEEETEK